MAEGFGKFIGFIGALCKNFWESFFEDTGFLFKAASEGPFDHPYETIFALMLAALLLTLLYGVFRTVMQRDINYFIRACESYVRAFGIAGAWLLTILIVSMVYEVVARYFFAAPTQWAFEMAYMLMGTSFMLGIGMCMQYRRHVRVDFLYDHVSPRWRAIIDLFGYVLLIPMLIWLSSGLWEYFHEAHRVGETSGESAWNPIIWPFKFSFVMGFLLLLMQTIVEAIKSIMVLAGREVAEPKAIAGLS